MEALQCRQLKIIFRVLQLIVPANCHYRVLVQCTKTGGLQLVSSSLPTLQPDLTKPPIQQNYNKPGTYNRLSNYSVKKFITMGAKKDFLEGVNGYDMSIKLGENMCTMYNVGYQRKLTLAHLAV